MLAVFWCEGLEEEDVGVMSLLKIEVQIQGIRPDLIHLSSTAHVATSDASPPDFDLATGRIDHRST